MHDWRRNSMLFISLIIVYDDKLFCSSEKDEGGLTL